MKVDRLVGIIMTLLDKRRIGAQELADMFEVSPRTIYRDIIPRDYQKPILHFDEIVETMQREIRIRIHKSILDRVLEYCTYDRFSPDGEECYIVNFPFIENDYHYDILLGFGDKCECPQPLHIRTVMKRKIQNMAALYDN